MVLAVLFVYAHFYFSAGSVHGGVLFDPALAT